MDCSPKICLLLSAVVWSGCKTPDQKKRNSKKKQELAGDMLRYSRKQRGVTTVTRMMTDRPDLWFNHSLVFKKCLASSVVPKPHFKPTEAKQSEGE